MAFAHHIAQVSYMASNMDNLVGSAEASSLGEKILNTVKETHGDDSKLRTLEQATQDSRVNQGYSANEPLLRDGTLRDSYDCVIGQDPSGNGKAVVIGSPEDIAVYQELGFYNVQAGKFVDARPVLMPSVLEHEEDIVNAFGEAMIGLFTKGQSGPGYHNESITYLD